MSGGDVPGSGREQSAVTRSSSSEVTEAIRRTLSNVTNASAQIAATHFELTRRRAGFGVGAVTTWALTNAIWRLSTPSFNATAMALSSYSDASTTVAMTAAGGFLGIAGDITTCLAKREETRDTLTTFIDIMHNIKNLDLVESITYKNYLTGSTSTLQPNADMRDAWKSCAEMKIKLRTGEVIKLSNVNNCGSRYMLTHVIAALTSISLYAACLGVTGVGLHDIMSKTNATTAYANTTTTDTGTIAPTISPIAASAIAALGTLPVLTFTNWLTTLCLQQEKQIAETSRLLWDRGIRDDKQLIDLLAKLEVFTPAQLVERSISRRTTTVRSTENESRDSLGEAHQATHNPPSEATDAVTEVAFSVLTSGEAASIAQDNVETAIHVAAREVGLSEDAEVNVLNLMANVINGAEQVIQAVSYRHPSESDSEHSTESYSGESRGSSIIQRLMGLRNTFEEGYQRLPLREGSEDTITQSRLRSWHSAPPSSTFHDPELGLPNLQDSPPSSPSSEPIGGSKAKRGKPL